jgi:predicted Ser/Thr protein kinase
VRQPHLDRVVALKILQPELAGDPAFAERFSREGRALAKLSHPNVVAVYDFGKAGEFYWLLMEYVDGVNLRQAMQAGSMTPREALQVVPMICAALEYAHSQGVLHRDIKPENILIDTQGRVKIADFGIAKMRGEGRHVTLTLSGSALGTPAYMAPEQIERPQDVDHRADIYSLGVVFYEMLTGELPLGRFLAPSEKAGTDPRLDSVVFRTLEKERDRRYQTAGEMKTHVETYAGAPAQRVRPKEERTSQKAVWSFVLTLLGIVLSLGSYIAATVETTRRREPSAQYGGVELSPNGGVQVRLHENAPVDSGPGSPNTVMLLIAALPLIVLLTGTFLGISALQDIRAAEGKLGGIHFAMIGAGFVPGTLIVAVTSMALESLGAEITRGRGRSASDLWAVVGSMPGIGLAYLFFRKLRRYGTGWTPPAAVTAHQPKRNFCSAAAVCFSIVGAALTVVCIAILPRSVRSDAREILIWSTLSALLIGVIMGALSRQETGGRTSAFVSGFLFVVMVLLAFT